MYKSRKDKFNSITKKTVIQIKHRKFKCIFLHFNQKRL
jgi:hypothetical protein